MRTSLLLLLLPLLVGFSNIEDTGNFDPQLVTLDGTTGRIPISLDGADTEGIELCGLEIGQTYTIIVGQSSVCQPFFQLPGQSKTSNQQVTIEATDKCLTFFAWPAASYSFCELYLLPSGLTHCQSSGGIPYHDRPYYPPSGIGRRYFFRGRLCGSS